MLRNAVPLVTLALHSIAGTSRKLLGEVWAGWSLLTWGSWVSPVVHGAAACCRQLTGRPGHKTECSPARPSDQ